MSARAVALGVGVAAAGAVALVVWRRRGTGAEGVGMSGVVTPERVEEEGETVIGWVAGRPTPITLRPISDGKKLRADAAAAFNAMRAQAAKAGVALVCNSGFRTNEEQARLHEGYVNRLPGFHMAAAPGWSNHQGGLSADIATGGRESIIYRWLTSNARHFGFVNDVPSEPWHWTFKPTQAALLK